jgi:hypothetical protein
MSGGAGEIAPREQCFHDQGVSGRAAHAARLQCADEFGFGENGRGRNAADGLRAARGHAVAFFQAGQGGSVSDGGRRGRRVNGLKPGVE